MKTNKANKANGVTNEAIEATTPAPIAVEAIEDANALGMVEIKPLSLDDQRAFFQTALDFIPDDALEATSQASGFSLPILHKLFALGFSRKLDASSASWAKTHESKEAYYRDLVGLLREGFWNQEEKNAHERALKEAMLPPKAPRGGKGSASATSTTYPRAATISHVRAYMLANGVDEGLVTRRIAALSATSDLAYNQWVELNTIEYQYAVECFKAEAQAKLDAAKLAAQSELDNLLSLMG